uniref:Uncharacterized protein n=1 Tax=Oryza punctata TaxID=4537 RepID=A0A0E0MEM7_ORYPU
MAMRVGDRAMGGGHGWAARCRQPRRSHGYGRGQWSSIGCRGNLHLPVRRWWLVVVDPVAALPLETRETSLSLATGFSKATGHRHLCHLLPNSPNPSRPLRRTAVVGVGCLRHHCCLHRLNYLAAAASSCVPAEEPCMRA